MANALQQALMSYRSAEAIPALLGVPEIVYMPEYRTGVLNQSGTTPGYKETIATILDLSVNGHHATQAADANRAHYLPVETDPYLYCSGLSVSGSTTGVSYYAAMTTGSVMTVDVDVALDDWTPTGGDYIISREQSSNASWALRINADGTIGFRWWGPAEKVTASTIATGLSDFSRSWIRVEYIENTGSGQYSVKFYLGSDGVSWSQLGSTVVGTTGVMTVSTARIELGGTLGNSVTFMAGRLYEAKLWDGATLVFHWDPDSSAHMAATFGNLIVGTGNPFTGEGQVIVKKGVILTRAGSFYSVASPFTVPPTWLHCFKYDSRAVATAQTLVTWANALSATLPQVFYQSTNAGNSMTCGSSSQYIVASSMGRRGDIVPSIISGVGNVRQNGTNASVTGPTNLAGGVVGKFLARDVACPSGVIYGRMALYTTGTMPTNTDADAWLAA
jgi:hypothetical protein